MNTVITFCTVAAACIVTLTSSALAIPAYARKYDMSCNVCHSPVPKLKSFGEEFAANGYQMKDKEPPRFTRETGDEKLLLMRELPLALRMDGYARYLPQNSPESDFQSPFILKILSSGQIARDVSYFLYFLFNEKGTVAGVEDAFLFFNNIGNVDFDITVGQYQVADPIFKRELRPTFEDYVIYTISPGHTKANLTYDRGITLGYSLPTNTTIIGSILNGNGIEAADDFGNFDSDPYKNFFVRVAQQVDSTLLIGGLGYLGKEREGDINNSFAMVGFDGRLSLGRWEIGAQYVYRNDKNPYFLSTATSNIKSHGAFVELMYAPQFDRSNWYFFALWNIVRSDIPELRYHTLTGNYSYMLSRNFRLIGEYTYDIEQKRNRFTVGFVTAF